MKISLHNAQYYSNVNLQPDGFEALLEAIGRQLGAVENVEDWGSYYDGIVVAKVIDCKPHPDADKLSVCIVDDGGANSEVDRNDQGYIQVVCGANNVAKGQTIAWIPPGVVVPNTVSDEEPFLLSSIELRGVMSHGMIASKKELLIADEHEGILVIDETGVDEELLKPGTDFKQLYGLDDIVLDLENKMFTHRPDCFGSLGVARELAGIQGQKFESPQWYQDELSFEVETDLPINVEVADQSLVSRFMISVVADVEVADSPVWLQSALTRIGIKPINNIVDITNFVMHLTSQPLHAYDYDKLKQRSKDVPTLIARSAQDGEKVTLLGGKKVVAHSEDIVISTDKELVGLGGVMGGADTEVDESTKNIVLECGSFDMYSIRRTAMHQGLFTDAVTRFNKGQSPWQNDRVIGYALKNILEQAGGKVAHEMIDIGNEASKSRLNVEANVDFINSRLGSELNPDQMKKLLDNVELGVELADSNLVVTPSFWRMDLEIAEDLVEEIGRLYGFHNLPVKLPNRPSSPVHRNIQLDFNNRVRQAMASAGANEVLTYSFVRSELFSQVGQDESQAYKIRNAISPDLQNYRLSLIPSLLERIQPNIRVGNDDIALFELNQVHDKQIPDPIEPDLPKEIPSLAMVVAVEDQLQRHITSGAPYFRALAHLRDLTQKLGISIRLEPLKSNMELSVVKSFEPTRSALVKSSDGQVIGVVGEFKAAILRKMKLPSYCAGFELGLDQLIDYSGSDAFYKPLSKYPSTQRDITLTVSDKHSFATVYQHILDHSEKSTIVEIVKPLSSYRADEKHDQRNLSFRLLYRSVDHTLTTEEVNQVVDDLTSELEAEFSAKVV